MQQVKFIDSLTPLRGIAALMVVFFHYDASLISNGLPRLISIKTTYLIARGNLWVEFFFILSGFVICHAYGRRFSTPTEGTFKKYIWSRFSRIYPLHFFIMILFAIYFLTLLLIEPDLAMKSESLYGLKDFFMQLFFLDALGLVNNWSWNVPSWSVASEWWIYSLAILVIPVINKNKPTVTIIALFVSLLALIFIHHFIHLNAPGSSLTRIGATLRCLCEFTIGVSIYQIYKNKRENQTVWNKDWMMYLVAIGVALNLHFPIYQVLIIPFFAALLLCASLNKGLPYKILNTKPFVILGDVSYSIYLIHFLWLLLFGLWIELYFKPTFPEVKPTNLVYILWLSSLLFFIIGSSYLTYRFVELPAQKKLRNVFR